MIIPSLPYLERYRNEGTRTYSRHSDYSEAETMYRPGGGAESFTLPVFRVPKRYLNIYTANPAEDLLHRYLHDVVALFCVHPQVLKRCGKDRYLQMIEQASLDIRTRGANPSGDLNHRPVTTIPYSSIDLKFACTRNSGNFLSRC